VIDARPVVAKGKMDKKVEVMFSSFGQKKKDRKEGK
jgi:hypothetical protein